MGNPDDYEDVTGQKQYLSPDEMNEMESVIYSISFGKQAIQNKVTYQAFSAAISQRMHVDMVMNFISRRKKIQEAKTCIVAYRLNSQQEEASMSDMSMNHANSRKSLKSH